MTNGWLAGLVGLALMALPATAFADDLAADATTTTANAGFWRRSDWVDYGIIAGSLAGFLAIHSLTPAAQSGIGPSFDPSHPAAILDPKLADRIGKPHLQEDKGETVPALYVGIAGPVVATWLGLQEGLGLDGGTRRAHDTVIGLAEGMATTLLVTEVLKYGFGRLRPDFQDRVRRHYCTTETSPEIACTGSEMPLDADPAKARKVFADGRRSFPSGHSATSWMLATYAGLVTGGHHVWGNRATPTSFKVGVGLQALAAGLAGFVVWSRVHDGRHNPSDVLAGSLIGVSMANLAYWRRFDTDGNLRGSKTGAAKPSAQLVPGPGDVGVGLAVRF